MQHVSSIYFECCGPYCGLQQTLRCISYAPLTTAYLTSVDNRVSMSIFFSSSLRHALPRISIAIIRKLALNHQLYRLAPASPSGFICMLQYTCPLLPVTSSWVQARAGLSGSLAGWTGHRSTHPSDLRLLSPQPRLACWYLSRALSAVMEPLLSLSPVPTERLSRLGQASPAGCPIRSHQLFTVSHFYSMSIFIPCRFFFPCR